MIDRIDDVIRAEQARWQVPGLTVGVLHEGRVETAAYGVASLETCQPAVPETLFQIGSISKVFTATLVMTLVEESALDLDAPVITYVPDLPLADETARRTMTLRHLLTHTGGFYGDRFDDHGNGDDALARAVAAFGDLPQQTAPDEIWTYCNAGFDLAGRAVERVTGRTFEQAMRERVFVPLGLDRATYFAHEAIRHAVAVGHVSGPGEAPRVADPWPIPRRSGPAGAISATAAELLRFARCHIQDGELDGVRLLSAEAASAMRRTRTAGDYGRTWGLGWSLREVGGELIAEHGGATNGFTARLTTVPARGFALAVLTNSEHGGAAHGAIGAAALERLLGLSSPPPARVTVDAEVLAGIAGRYHHELADVSLGVEDGGFRADIVSHSPFSGALTARDPFHLSPIGNDCFVVDDGEQAGAVLEVFRNGDGGVRFLRFGGRLAHPA